MSVSEAATTSPPPPPVSAGDRATSWVDNWFDHWPFGGRFPSSFLTRIGEIEPVRVEQFRQNGNLVIRAEMPGIENDDDIDVSIAGDKLTVSAKREHKTQSEEDGTFQSEFHYGSFRRTVSVPPGTDADDVSATYVNGIVEVRVKVDEESAEPRKITVSRS